MPLTMRAASPPLVYACSGCSSAAQLANDLALRLDRAGVAEMSCIAGIGGNVPSLVRKAREAVDAARPLVVLDGCVLACAKSCLAQRDMVPTVHVQLWRAGVRKQYHADFDAAQADALYARLKEEIETMSEAHAGSGVGP